MKKPAIWIYKTSEQLRSILGKGWRSITGRRSGPETTPNNGADGKLPIDEDSGFIDRLNRKYLKLPPPFASVLKPLVVIFCLIAAYAVFGFYLLPAILTSKLPGIIVSETGRKAVVSRIEFNPFKLFADIKGFEIQEKNGKRFIGFDRLTVDLNGFASLKQLALVVEQINLVKPTVHLAKTKDGKFNFDDLAKSDKKEPEKKDSGKPFPLSIGTLSIVNGDLQWEDQHFAKPVSEQITPINLTLHNVSTQPGNVGDVAFDLSLKSGGQAAWKSKLGVNPLFSEGNLHLDKLELTKILSLALSDTAAYDLKGRGLFNADFSVGMDKKDLILTVKKTKLELRDFQFTDKSDAQNTFKTPNFSAETDIKLTLAEAGLQAVIKELKLAGQDMVFSNRGDQAVTVKIPSFNHTTDIKIARVKDKLDITAAKASIAVKDLVFNGLKEQMAEIAIPGITLETAFQIGLSGEALTINTNKGRFGFQNLRLTEKSEAQDLIKIPSFDLKDLTFDLNNRSISAASVVSKDAEIRAWLNPDGTVNYLKLVASEAPPKKVVTRSEYATARTVDYKEDNKTPDAVPVTPAKPVKAATPDKPWRFAINSLELSNYAVNFQDKTGKKPVTLNAKPVNLKLNNISNDLKAELPFQFDMKLNKSGSIQLKGGAVITPLSAKTDVDIKNIALEPFQPYVDKFARVDLLKGDFNISGKLAINQPAGKPLDVKFKGGTGIKDLLTRDQLQNKDLVKWQNLTLKDLDVDVLANRYTSSLLLIEKPYAKVTIRKDKTVNFSDIMIAEKSSGAKPAKASTPGKPKKQSMPDGNKPFFKLDKVKIVDGSSDFADLSLILPFAAQIKSLDGGANGISSEKKSTVKVDLKGNAYDLAPVDIKGEISPYLGNYNIDLKFDGMPMPLVTPYMVEFAGYKIEKGKLTLGLKYQVENGKLQAANSILIDQLELGEKVDNPKAVSLPLELAITLLKDSDGKIKLDVPLTGSLEDPQFSIGHIVVDALVNVLTKVITSPFTAIASLVGSDEDLSSIAFAPGKDTLSSAETGKLDNIAKALKEKPALNLEIKGAAYELQDWRILRDDALLDQLKSAKSAQISEEEGKKVRSEYVELSTDDYNELLADAFIKRFPTMAEKSLLGTPKLIPPLTGDFYQVAKEKMAELIKPDPKRLKDLASERAKEIAKYMVQNGGIAHERVYILDSVLDPERKDKDLVSLLSLKTN